MDSQQTGEPAKDKSQASDSGQAGMTKPETELIELDELDGVKAERDENLAGWQRAAADLQNYKKQVETEKGLLLKLANATLLLKILPVYNSLLIAEKNLPTELAANDWAKGMLQIKKQLEEVLASENIKQIITVGQMFDPNLHEAISYEESELPDGSIIDEIETGYLIEDKVLIPARVRVSKGSENRT